MRLWSAVQVLTTAQGRRFKASLFTLPRIWAQIQVQLSSEPIKPPTLSAYLHTSFAEIQGGLPSRESRLL